VIGGFVVLGLTMAVVATITGRRQPDDASTRPRAIVLAVGMFPLLVIGVLAARGAIDAVVRLILGPEAGVLGGIADAVAGGALGGVPGGFGDLGIDATDAAVRALVSSAIVAIVAFALFRLLLDWRDGLTGEAAFPGSPAARVLQSFAYLVVLMFVALFAVGVVEAGYGLFRVIAPGTSAVLGIGESAEREAGVADIVSGAALAAASWWLFQTHWKLAATWRGTGSPDVPGPPPAAG
jgi:hypothetical protein